MFGLHYSESLIYCLNSTHFNPCFMAKLRENNVGANSIDGIQAKIGISYLPTNRTLLMLPLQGEDCPTDPEEMIISGEPTYNLGNMFNHLKPQVEVGIKTGDDAEPIDNVVVGFKSISDFEPENIIGNVPLLSKLRDQQMLIQRLESLLQEGVFQRMMKDKTQKAALVSFLKSVIADVETHEKE